MMSQKFHASAMVYAAVVAVCASALPVSAQVAYDTIAFTGEMAPGTTGVYNSFSNPAIDDAGQTAFSATLTGTGVDASNDSGVWSEGSGALGLIAREGSAAPGTGAGVVFGNFNNIIAPRFNGAGQTAFEGILTGTGVTTSNDDGIWSEGSGTLSLVVREGDAAPGAGAGVVFDFESDGFVLNGAGQIAFESDLNGTGLTSHNHKSIWATDTNGLLTLIAQEGDLFDVNDDPGIDDLRTIDNLNLFNSQGGEDGKSTSFNDAG